MNRTVVSLRPYARAGVALVPLFFLAGCSGGSGEASGTAARHGLERSEFIALKKAGMSRGDIRKAELIKKIARLKEEGAVVETTSRKKTKKEH